MEDHRPVMSRADQVTAPFLRRVLLAFVGVTAFSMASFFGFVWWTQTSPQLSAHRLVPYWEFPMEDVQHEWRDARMNAVTSILMENGRHLHFTTHFNADAPTSEEPYFPDEFYEGVVYGITASNQKGKQGSPEDNDKANAELLKDLQSMWPAPARIMPRRSRSEDDLFHEDGFAVYFHEHTIEAERGLLYLARVFGQPGVLKWWGHVWSHHPRDHVTVMQAIVPVASSLNHFRYELPARMVGVAPDDWLDGLSLPDQHPHAPDSHTEL